MAFQTSVTLFFLHLFLLLGLPACLVQAAPVTDAGISARDSSDYWVGSVKRQGAVAFGSGGDYNVYRNVKDFGAKGNITAPTGKTFKVTY